MHSHSGLLLPAVLMSSLLQAQLPVWDASTLARGWSRVDVTGACAFFDAAGQKIQLWSPDGALSGAVPTQKVPAPPERFFFDSRNNAWIAAGAMLVNVDKAGKVLETQKLPVEVADLTWDARSMYVVYRSVGLFVEKRDMKSGDVLWSHGTRPAPEGRTPVVLFRLALTDDGKQLLVAAGNDLGLIALDAQTGKVAQPIRFAPATPIPATLQVSDRGRSPIHTWPGRPILLLSATTRELNQSGDETLQLLKADLGTKQVSQQNTGLSTDHTFIGVLDNQAVFTKPTGGLAQIPLQ